jgi:glycosyltransferase involved in cell wall biosynthesis
VNDGRISVLELRSVWGTGGGPEKTILFGAELRERARFDVTVCYLRDARDAVFGIDRRAGRLDVDYVEIRERHSFDPGIWRPLRQLVRDRKIDIVHAHDYKTILLALMLGRSDGVIPLGTAHGWTGQGARERYVYYPAAKWLLRWFPRVIAVSTELKDNLGWRGAMKDKVIVVLNAIDPAAFKRTPEKRAAVRQALSYGPDDVVIGAVARLEIQKRFDLLIAVFANLAKTRPGLRLAIVGDGSLRSELTALASKLGVGDRCAFLGHRDDISDLHHAFDLFVQSSEYEGTSNSVLEAMAMETPLVATDVGGTKELAAPDVHALIVPNRDVGALEGAIAAVLADPVSARARAAAARRRIESELSFETRTRRLEVIYDELMRERQDAAGSRSTPE